MKLFLKSKFKLVSHSHTPILQTSSNNQNFYFYFIGVIQTPRQIKQRVCKLFFFTLKVDSDFSFRDLYANYFLH